MKIFRSFVFAVWFFVAFACEALAHPYELLNACEHGNLSRVEYLLQNGEDVNAVDAYHRSGLYFAAMNGHNDIVKLLIEHGAKIDALTERMWTPLLIATDEGHTDTVKLLVQYGADVNAVVQSWTALLLAANSGNGELVAFLLDNGADINAQMDGGWSALMLALHKDHPDVAKILIERGADVNHKNKHGRTAMSLATRKGFDDVVEMLVEHGAVKTVKDIRSAMERALDEKDISRVAEMIANGLDVNMRNGFGDTMLIKATEANRVDLVELLLKNGARVNAKNNLGDSALSGAVSYGYKDIVELLIRYGADVNIRDFSHSVLYRAAERGHTDIMNLLIEHGAIIDIHTDEGKIVFLCRHLKMDSQLAVYLVNDWIFYYYWILILVYIICYNRSLVRACKVGNTERVVKLVQKHFKLYSSVGVGYVLHALEVAKAKNRADIVGILQGLVDSIAPKNKSFLEEEEEEHFNPQKGREILLDICERGDEDALIKLFSENTLFYFDHQDYVHEAIELAKKNHNQDIVDDLYAAFNIEDESV